MGTGDDCLKLTFRPETQAHCKWGSSSLGLMGSTPKPVVGAVQAGGPSFSATPQKSPVFDRYVPPEPGNFLDDFSLPEKGKVRWSLGQTGWELSVVAVPIGPQVAYARPTLVDMERWSWRSDPASAGWQGVSMFVKSSMPPPVIGYFGGRPVYSGDRSAQTLPPSQYERPSSFGWRWIEGMEYVPAVVIGRHF